MTSTLGWKSMTLAERERAYSPSSMIGGDLTAVIADYRDNSEAARQRMPPLTARYGDGPDELIDVFGAGTSRHDAPVLVFIHGGYWQELSRRESAFHLTELLDAGWTVAVPDYTLAPQATITSMVDQCLRAVRWCISQAAAWGTRTELVISGSSAGAHLAAMVLTHDVAVRQAVLFSGIYELEPLVGTYINDVLGLDPTSAGALSPIRMEPHHAVPLVICDGAIETTEFQAQSNDFAAAWSAHGCAVTRVTVAGRNHFDVPYDLAKLVDLS